MKLIISGREGTQGGSGGELLEDIALHNKVHRITLLKKNVYNFVTIKGKHLWRNKNNEENSLIRNAKQWMKDIDRLVSKKIPLQVFCVNLATYFNALVAPSLRL